jgi:hypothetical protein
VPITVPKSMSRVIMRAFQHRSYRKAASPAQWRT